MGDSRLALQVLLILLLVLAGTPGGAAPLEWTASSDPTRVVFQSSALGESTRSATISGRGRVEFWLETPRSPAFQQEILWLDEAKHRELVIGAIQSGLPEWGDDNRLARLLRSSPDAVRKASNK